MTSMDLLEDSPVLVVDNYWEAFEMGCYCDSTLSVVAALVGY